MSYVGMFDLTGDGDESGEELVDLSNPTLTHFQKVSNDAKLAREESKMALRKAKAAAEAAELAHKLAMAAKQAAEDTANQLETSTTSSVEDTMTSVVNDVVETGETMLEPLPCSRRRKRSPSLSAVDLSEETTPSLKAIENSALTGEPHSISSTLSTAASITDAPPVNIDPVKVRRRITPTIVNEPPEIPPPTIVPTTPAITFPLSPGGTVPIDLPVVRVPEVITGLETVGIWRETCHLPIYDQMLSVTRSVWRSQIRHRWGKIPWSLFVTCNENKMGIRELTRRGQRIPTPAEFLNWRLKQTELTESMNKDPKTETKNSENDSEMDYPDNLYELGFYLGVDEGVTIPRSARVNFYFSVFTSPQHDTHQNITPASPMETTSEANGDKSTTYDNEPWAPLLLDSGEEALERLKNAVSVSSSLDFRIDAGVAQTRIDYGNPVFPLSALVGIVPREDLQAWEEEKERRRQSAKLTVPPTDHQDGSLSPAKKIRVSDDSFSDLTINITTLTFHLEVHIRESFLPRALPVLYNSKQSTGLVGLENQGATCYLNSLLQMLFQLSRFRQAVYEISTTGEASLRSSTTLALQSVFHKLQRVEEDVTTRDLTAAFGWNDVEAFQQQDAQEMMRILLDKLEEVMKKKAKGTIANSEGEDTTPEVTNSTADSTTSCNEASKTVIHQLFCGRMASYVRCINVEMESRREEEFYDLQLDVKGCSSVSESLCKYVSEDRLEGENQYDAGVQFGKQDALKGVRFEEFPPVLTVQLKRFDFDLEVMEFRKVHSRFEFPCTLDIDEILPPQASPSTSKNPSQESNLSSTDTPLRRQSVRNIYHLQSVLVHQGDVGGGHYYAYIRPPTEKNYRAAYGLGEQRTVELRDYEKTPHLKLLSTPPYISNEEIWEEDEWFKFNDERVSRVEKREAIDYCFGNSPTIRGGRGGGGSAYMLVYVRAAEAPVLMAPHQISQIPSSLLARLRAEERLRRRADRREWVNRQFIMSHWVSMRDLESITLSSSGRGKTARNSFGGGSMALCSVLDFFPERCMRGSTRLSLLLEISRRWGISPNCLRLWKVTASNVNSGLKIQECIRTVKHHGKIAVESSAEDTEIENKSSLNRALCGGEKFFVERLDEVPISLSPELREGGGYLTHQEYITTNEIFTNEWSEIERREIAWKAKVDTELRKLEKSFEEEAQSTPEDIRAQQEAMQGAIIAGTTSSSVTEDSNSSILSPADPNNLHNSSNANEIVPDEISLLMTACGIGGGNETVLSELLTHNPTRANELLAEISTLEREAHNVLAIFTPQPSRTAVLMFIRAYDPLDILPLPTPILAPDGNRNGSCRWIPNPSTLSITDKTKLEFSLTTIPTEAGVVFTPTLHAWKHALSSSRDFFNLSSNWLAGTLLCQTRRRPEPEPLKLAGVIAICRNSPISILDEVLAICLRQEKSFYEQLIYNRKTDASAVYVAESHLTVPDLGDPWQARLTSRMSDDSVVALAAVALSEEVQRLSTFSQPDAAHILDTMVRDSEKNFMGDAIEWYTLDGSARVSQLTTIVSVPGGDNVTEIHDPLTKQNYPSFTSLAATSFRVATIEDFLSSKSGVGFSVVASLSSTDLTCHVLNENEHTHGSEVGDYRKYGVDEFLTIARERRHVTISPFSLADSAILRVVSANSKKHMAYTKIRSIKRQLRKLEEQENLGDKPSSRVHDEDDYTDASDLATQSNRRHEWERLEDELFKAKEELQNVIASANEFLKCTFMKSCSSGPLINSTSDSISLDKLSDESSSSPDTILEPFVLIEGFETSWPLESPLDGLFQHIATQLDLSPSHLVLYIVPEPPTDEFDNEELDSLIGSVLPLKPQFASQYTLASLGESRPQATRFAIRWRLVPQDISNPVSTKETDEPFVTTLLLAHPKLRERQSAALRKYAEWVCCEAEFIDTNETSMTTTQKIARREKKRLRQQFLRNMASAYGVSSEDDLPYLSLSDFSLQIVSSEPLPTMSQVATQVRNILGMVSEIPSVEDIMETGSPYDLIMRPFHGKTSKEAFDLLLEIAKEAFPDFGSLPLLSTHECALILNDLEPYGWESLANATIQTLLTMEARQETSGNNTRVPSTTSHVSKLTTISTEAEPTFVRLVYFAVNIVLVESYLLKHYATTSTIPRKRLDEAILIASELINFVSSINKGDAPSGYFHLPTLTFLYGHSSQEITRSAIRDWSTSVLADTILHLDSFSSSEITDEPLPECLLLNEVLSVCHTQSHTVQTTLHSNVCFPFYSWECLRSSVSGAVEHSYLIQNWHPMEIPLLFSAYPHIRSIPISIMFFTVSGGGLVRTCSPPIPSALGIAYLVGEDDVETLRKRVERLFGIDLSGYRMAWIDLISRTPSFLQRNSPITPPANGVHNPESDSSNGPRPWDVLLSKHPNLQNSDLAVLGFQRSSAEFASGESVRRPQGIRIV